MLSAMNGLILSKPVIITDAPLVVADIIKNVEWATDNNENNVDNTTAFSLKKDEMNRNIAHPTVCPVTPYFILSAAR